MTFRPLRFRLHVEKVPWLSVSWSARTKNRKSEKKVSSIALEPLPTISSVLSPCMHSRSDTFFLLYPIWYFFVFERSRQAKKKKKIPRSPGGFSWSWSWEVTIIMIFIHPLFSANATVSFPIFICTSYFRSRFFLSSYLDLGISLADVTHRSIHFPIINSIPHLPGVVSSLLRFALPSSLFRLADIPFLSTLNRSWLRFNAAYAPDLPSSISSGIWADRRRRLFLVVLFFNSSCPLFLSTTLDACLSYWFIFRQPQKKWYSPIPAALQYSPVSVFLFLTVVLLTMSSFSLSSCSPFRAELGCKLTTTLTE